MGRPIVDCNDKYGRKLYIRVCRLYLQDGSNKYWAIESKSVDYAVASSVFKHSINFKLFTIRFSSKFAVNEIKDPNTPYACHILMS